MELLERGDEVAALGSWLGEAGSGAGRVVLVAGEAGIGKTSLVRTFCDEHADQARVWWGACDALTTPRPLGPLYDIARVARGEFASLMAGDVSRHERFAGFLEALAWPLQPTIAVIEDAHWADEATRDLLVFVARRIADVNAMVVVTYRDDEVGTEHPLRQVLGSVATLPVARRLALSGLSEAAVVRLASEQDTDASQVFRVTGGNPFFVTEVLAAGAGKVPETVSDAVLARAGRLSASGRSVLEAAAVVPDQVEVDLVQAVAADESGAIEECVQAGLLLAVGRSLRFRHELARLAVELAISGPRLHELHTAVLGYLTAQTGADPARLAYHAAQAGDRDAVLTHAPVAAETARRLGAHREAAAHYRRTLQHADVLDPREHADLLERYADECTLTGDLAATAEALEQAEDLTRLSGDHARAASLTARRCGVLGNLGHVQLARDLMRDALTTLQSMEPDRWHAAAYAQAAQSAMFDRRCDEALELAERALTLAEATHHDRAAALAVHAGGCAQWFVDPHDAASSMEEALARAERLGDDRLIWLTLHNAGSGAGEVRRYDTAVPWLQRAVGFGRAHDLDFEAAVGLAWLARIDFERGAWGRALDGLRELESEHGFLLRAQADAVRGRILVRRGLPEHSRALDAAWELVAPQQLLQLTWPVVAGLAERSWLAGEPADARPLVVPLFEQALGRDQAWAIGELGFWLWRAGVLEGPPEGAAAPFALQMAGDWREAAAAWEQVGCPYEVAVALADGDDPDELKRALEILGGLGAVPMADRVAAKLRGLGVHDLPRRPSRATVENPGGLTGRQLEVLGQLVEGRTNAEIAQRLHISPKTVGHHVSAILGKLGVADRQQAARVARDQGLTPT